MKLSTGVLTALTFLSLGAAVNAGSVTGTGFDKSATIEDLKSSAPQGAKITNTRCDTVGGPSGGGGQQVSLYGDLGVNQLEWSSPTISQPEDPESLSRQNHLPCLLSRWLNDPRQSMIRTDTLSKELDLHNHRPTKLSSGSISESLTFEKGLIDHGKTD